MSHLSTMEPRGKTLQQHKIKKKFFKHAWVKNIMQIHFSFPYPSNHEVELILFTELARYVKSSFYPVQSFRGSTASTRQERALDGM